MKRVLSALALCCLAWQVRAAAAVECQAPPVLTKQHAVCLARLFNQQQSPPEWPLVYEVSESKHHWFVYYSPDPSAGVRGGAGDLSVEKATGKVIFLRGYK